MRAVDPVPDLEGSVDEEVVGRVVLAGAVVVCAAHTGRMPLSESHRRAKALR